MAQQAPAMPPPMPPALGPSISGPLSYNPAPITLNLGPYAEKVYVTGAVTGLGFWESNATRIGSDSSSRLDISNGQLIVQKIDGFFQFFVAFLKFAPADNLSVMVGKLPTLQGDEYTFTFENMNIFRGLLWNQENAVNRGVQVNYSMGPLAFSVSLNDGYYSNRYNWLGGSVAYTIDMENTVSFVGDGNLGHTGYATAATPLFQNNGAVFNLIYTHTAGPLVISPYLQFTTVPANPAIGIPHSASTTGVALLASYGITDNFKLAGRAEYISSTGKGATLGSSTNLLYGPGSSAFAFTITPTFQYNIFFARAEYSIVTASSTTPGFAFGPNGTAKDQNRLAIEAGVLF